MNTCSEDGEGDQPERGEVCDGGRDHRGAGEEGHAGGLQRKQVSGDVFPDLKYPFELNSIVIVGPSDLMSFSTHSPIGELARKDLLAV